ncbi:MAG: hypothetical protein K0S96_484 [Geminicoccaceae bacterium]|nr:hypothetical protein [Geminicoccaceae bacterium]MDF2780680.1 hypothetical protein [Geminicoccaceae bacterium]
MTLCARAATLAVALAGLAGTCLGSAAFGQSAQPGGVRINGSVVNQTMVGGSTNLAAGVGSRALTSVGSIAQNVRIDGRLNVTVQTGHIANVASGVGQRAVTSVGSVTEGTRLAGQNEVVISTGQIINMSDPSGRPACVVVGSFGDVPGC